MRTQILLSMLLLAPLVARAQLKPPPPQPDYPKTDLVPGYAVDPDWPHDRPEKPWGEMSGVAIDPRDGNIWTLNRSEVPVQVFSPDGKLLQTWSNEHVKKGHQIRFDPRDGNVWITDLVLHVARKFDRTGRPLLTIGTPGEAGADDTHLFQPTDIAIAPSGEVFISDGYGNNRIVHCDAAGKFIKSWGSLGVKDGEFSLPHSIVIDSKGQLYVADRNNCRVQVFDQSGKFLRAFSGRMVPWTLHVSDGDDIYVIGASPDRWPRTGRMLGVPPRDQIVMRINPQLEIQSWWGFDFQPDARAATTRPGALCWVHALAVDRRGNLYLGDIQGKRIQKFQALAPGSGKLATQP